MIVYTLGTSRKTLRYMIIFPFSCVCIGAFMEHVTVPGGKISVNKDFF